MTTELIRCPFCRGKAELFHCALPRCVGVNASIVAYGCCTGCGARGPEASFSAESGWIEVPQVLQVKICLQARELWNRQGEPITAERIARWMRLLRHSLGLKDAVLSADDDQRNHYCANVDVNCSTHNDLMDMAELGLLEIGQTINEGRHQYFHVTGKGKALL
jgi:hypothetical protein